MTTLLLAALSAVLYGAGVAVEHRQAARTSTEVAGRPRLLALLARQPLWLIGAALEAGGFAMHAAALRSGSLAAVQMILGCSLLVSVSLSSLLARRPLPRRCWPAVFAIVASVGVSVALLGPDEHAGGPASSGPAAAAALVTGLITVPIAAAGLLVEGRRARPLLLAAAAGMADTCVAVLTMAFAQSLGHGIGAVATSWPTYALIVGGLASLALTQAAYQTDAPLITLPIISAVTPLASLTVGILVLHEATHLSGTRSVIGGICLTLAVTALTVLARAAARTQQAPVTRQAPAAPAGRPSTVRPAGLPGQGSRTADRRVDRHGDRHADRDGDRRLPAMRETPCQTSRLSRTG
ncbi:MAG TPA: DMT family transporter [Actinospica sp.]|nr:DMT family transporter [Actinospica sp.]